MGRQPDHHADVVCAASTEGETTDAEATVSPADRPPVTWIGREPAPHDPDEGLGVRLRALAGRHRRLVVSAGVFLALAAAAALTMRLIVKPKLLVPLADQHTVPLVSVIVPGVRPVSSEIMVTGTIEARHDLPIGDGGQAGRIVAVYVQIGDRVRRGELLARLD